MAIVHRDVLSEILVRVDPSLIFDCILVSKGWLELITDPEFRQLYQEKWKTHSKLVGFTKNCYGSTNLVATSELGRIINENESMHSFFMSKSGQGDGLILFGMLPDILFVSKPGDENPVRLPGGSAASTAIFSDQNNSFRVLLITQNDYWSVETFSSSTGEWKSSSYLVDKDDMPGCFENGKSGIVSSGRNVVYWPQRDGYGSSWICAYYDNPNDDDDYDDKQKPIRCHNGPDDDDDDGDKCNRIQNYGLSSEGYLLKATSGKGFGHRINMWRLDDDDDDDDDDDVIGWTLLNTILPHPIPRRFAFVSFFPASPGAIVVESGHRLFLYRPDQSRELDTSAPLSKQAWVNSHWNHASLDLAPLTMADLGVWPSSPFSRASKTNIHGVKQMVAMTLSAHRDRVRQYMADRASPRLSEEPVRRNRRMYGVLNIL